MGERDRPNENQPYIVAPAEFINPASLYVKPTPYEFGKRVTRPNFTSFIIGSFQRSEGDRVSLKGQFEWLRVNRQFRYEETFSFFEVAGGYFRLSKTEKTMLAFSLPPILKHQGYESPEYRLPSAFAEALFTELTPRENTDFQNAFSGMQLRELSSPEDFLVYLKGYTDGKKRKL